MYLLKHISNLDEIVLEYHHRADVPKKPYKGNSYLHLNKILKILSEGCRNRDRKFASLSIAGYIIGFISVISWVGFGYFANAISTNVTDGYQSSKLNTILNVIAGFMDTAACGFVIYSLMTGVPFLSIPVIVAASVSLLLRIIFAVYLGNQIHEVREEIKEMTEFDQIR